VARCLRKLKLAFALEQAFKLKSADLVAELIGRHGLRAIDIARETGKRPADISEVYATVRAFPPGQRPPRAPFTHLLLAKRMLGQFPELRMQPAEAYAEIRSAGLTQYRDVTRHFGRLLRQAEARRLPAPTIGPTGASSPINQTFHARFQDVLPLFDDHSVQIFSLDPPCVFAGADGGRTYRARSARSLSCDAGGDPAAALALALDTLRLGLPKLARGGVLLLWQPWQSLLAPIGDMAAEHGWSIIGPIIWEKGRPQPGRLDSEYSIQGGVLWLLHRAGDVVRNHDGSSRQMILQFPPVSFPGRAHRQTHGYEKPVELCEHLIRKHSRPGDLIFDACGCTGTMSVAAINLGRRWAYAESNRDNYMFGDSRIADTLGKTVAIAS
jgi:DNA modification methylase